MYCCKCYIEYGKQKEHLISDRGDFYAIFVKTENLLRLKCMHP